MVELLLDQWEGPVSLALYMSDTEAAQFEDFTLESEIVSKRTNVGYHVVYKEGVSTKDGQVEQTLIQRLCHQNNSTTADYKNSSMYCLFGKLNS